MQSSEPNWNRPLALREMLGYLNFSEGNADVRFQRNVNEFFRHASNAEPWQELDQALRDSISELRGTSTAFRNTHQAEAVIELVFAKLLPAYRAHHADLLFHLSDAELVQPLFLARAFEAVLAEAGPWNETDRILRGSLQRLNDFVGYRPVAVLERKRCEPFDHERVRPIPLFIRGAGVAVGKYEGIITRAFEILGKTDPELLREAQFDLDMLDELALDPRAYDFAHPVNQRPNYQFGEWDPHCIDNAGNYRRFVVRQVTLDALLERAQVPSQGSAKTEAEAAAAPPDSGQNSTESSFLNPEPRTLNPEPLFPAEPRLLEASAVLAGTMLMAAGTSGSGPDAYDSSVTLATLVPKIARFRDQFYERLIQTVPGRHGDALRDEAARLHQPFGGARQHLNQYLARRRAAQLQHAHVAQLYAEMGYPDAGRDESRRVATVSGRITTEMLCRITASHLRLDQGDLASAFAVSKSLEDLLHRAIRCGAIADPWNILGFQGQFSIFPAIENTVPDPRIDQLTELVEQIFLLYARLMAEAAATADEGVETTVRQRFQKLAAWWDQFATVEIGGVHHVHGRKTLEAALHVAQAMGAWRRAGEAAGNIRFWREHSSGFNSPRAFTQVVHALLEKRDHVAAMALLMSWLSQAGDIPLQQEPHSFHELAVRWLLDVLRREGSGFGVQGSAGEEGSGVRGQGSAGEADAAPPDSAKNFTESSSPNSEPRTLNPHSEPRTLNPSSWPLVVKFFDYLEANADEYWLVPSFELGKNEQERGEAEAHDASDETDDDADGDDVYSAAYDGVTYRDSAQDGHEGELVEGGSVRSESEFEAAAERIEPRLEFLSTLATLWRIAADHSLQSHLASLGTTLEAGATDRAPRATHPEQAIAPSDRSSVLMSWLSKLRQNQDGLARLVRQIEQIPVPQPLGSHDSLVEYDRRRSDKEHLIYEVIATQVESAGALRRLLCAFPTNPVDVSMAEWERHAVAVERALPREDTDTVRALLPPLLEALAQVPLLYRPLEHGGEAAHIVAAQSVQQTLKFLVESLPRAGLLREAYHLLRTARQMEQNHRGGSESITEFDRLNRAALHAVAESVVDASSHWTGQEQADRPLLECLERITEPFMKLWLEHSQTVRLSALDRVRDDAEWQEIRKFIENYGRDLLTPVFLTLGNLRGILDHGVGRYLDYLAENADPLQPIRLIGDLGQKIGRAVAQRSLELVIQVFVENYEEYKDYNTTTTQSDYGERFFILLEFLRLKAWYARASWNLQPVGIVHEVLACSGRADAAQLWQEALTDKTSAMADNLLERLNALEKKVGVRLVTVRDRLAERFNRPLALDRVRILIGPAIEEARTETSVNEDVSDEATAGGTSVQHETGSPSGRRIAFKRFQEAIRQFAETTSGVGLDVPTWLRVLKAEVDRLRHTRGITFEGSEHSWAMPRAKFSRQHVDVQLESWDEPL